MQEENKNTQIEETNLEGEEQQTTVKTEEEIRKELEEQFQREADRRVSQALEKKRREWQAEMEEKERLSKLSEEERIKELERKREQEVSERERKVREKELEIIKRDTLSELELPLELKDLFNVSNYLDKEDDEFVNSIKTFKEVFDTVLEAKLEEAKQEYLKGSTPNGVKANKTELSSYEQAKLKGDVQNMILSKLQGK